MIDEKKLIQEIWSLFNKIYNDAQKYDESETKFAEDILSNVQKIIENQDKISEWILCSDRMPTKEECESFKIFQTTINTENSVTVLMNFVYETVGNKEVGRWIWGGGVSPWEVIAWKPLSEPYREDY